MIDTAVNRMPQGIALGVGEQIVKQYKVGRYTFRQGSIEVIVTNKRVIRYEESSLFGMQNNQIDEINIDAVHGMYTHMKRSISIIGLVASLILIIYGIAMLSAGGRYGGYGGMQIYGFISLALAALIIFLSLKPSLEFGLMGAIGNPALGTVVNTRGRLFRRESNGVVFQFKPTADTTVMLKELGACVYDLKTLGDRAIEKWR